MGEASLSENFSVDSCENSPAHMDNEESGIAMQIDEEEEEQEEEEQEEQCGEPVQSDIEHPSAEEPQQARLPESGHIFQPSLPNDESHANLYERFQGPNACEVITRTFPELSSEAAAQLLCAFDGDVHAGIVAYARSKELQEQRKRAQEQARIRELQHWHEQNQQM